MGSELDLLIADGVIDAVLGRLKSGKEADISLVQRGELVLAAKVYKDRATRSFKNNAEYKSVSCAPFDAVDSPADRLSVIPALGVPVHGVMRFSCPGMPNQSLSPMSSVIGDAITGVATISVAASKKIDRTSFTD